MAMKKGAPFHPTYNCSISFDPTTGSIEEFWINIPGGRFSCRISEPSTACEHVVSL